MNKAEAQVIAEALLKARSFYEDRLFKVREEIEKRKKSNLQESDKLKNLSILTLEASAEKWSKICIQINNDWNEVTRKWIMTDSAN